MPEIIIGSPNQHMMAVNNSGAVPMAAYSGGTIYPLLVNTAGELLTTATVAGVTTGSEAYLWGSSGTGFYRVLVDAAGRVETNTTVLSVFIASGADIGSVYLKDGAFVSIIASGTTGIPISGAITVDDMLGSVAISTDPIPVSGAYFPGSNVLLESLPTDSALNNPWMTLEYISSGAGTGIDTGSVIGSITQFVGAGSYVKSLTYSNNNLTNIGSWT